MICFSPTEDATEEPSEGVSELEPGRSRASERAGLRGSAESAPRRAASGRFSAIRRRVGFVQVSYYLFGDPAERLYLLRS